MAKLIYYTPPADQLTVTPAGVHIPLHAVAQAEIAQRRVLKGLYYIQAVAVGVDNVDVQYLHNYDSVGAGRDPVGPTALPSLGIGKIPGDSSVLFTSETIEGEILKQYASNGDTVGGPFVWVASDSAQLIWGLYRFDPMQLRR